MLPNTPLHRHWPGLFIVTLNITCKIVVLFVFNFNFSGFCFIYLRKRARMQNLGFYVPWSDWARKIYILILRPYSNWVCGSPKFLNQKFFMLTFFCINHFCTVQKNRHVSEKNIVYTLYLVFEHSYPIPSTTTSNFERIKTSCVGLLVKFTSFLQRW